MGSKKIIGIVSAFVLTLAGGGYFYYHSQVSADTVDANRGTVIQAVDKNGQAIAKIVTLDLTVTLSNRSETSCPRWQRYIRSGFPRYHSLTTYPHSCSTVSNTKFLKLPVVTNEKGEFTVSSAMFHRLSDSEKSAIASAITKEVTGKNVNLENLRVIWSTNSISSDYNSGKTLTSAQVEKALTMFLSKMSITKDQIHQIAVKTTDTLNLDNTTLAQFSDFNKKNDINEFTFLDYVFVQASGLFASDLKVVMFDTANYKSNLSLTVGDSNSTTTSCFTSSPQSLSKNGGFESALESWSSAADLGENTIIDSSTSFACATGSKCLKMTANQGTNQHLVQQIGKLEQGKKYVFSADFFADGADGQINVYDNKTGKGYGLVISGNGVWKTASVTIPVENADNDFYLFVYADKHGTSKSTVYYDNLTFTQVN